VSAAKRATADGVVFITDRGRPAFEHLNSTMIDTYMDFLEMDFRGQSAASFTR
jgi:hypothetical protein